MSRACAEKMQRDEASPQGLSEVDKGKLESERRKLHNEVQMLKGAVRVYARIRPKDVKTAGKERGPGAVLSSNYN